MHWTFSAIIFILRSPGCRSLMKHKSSICFNLIASVCHLCVRLLMFKIPEIVWKFYIRKQTASNAGWCNALGAWNADKHIESKQKQITESVCKLDFQLNLVDRLALSMLHVFPSLHLLCSLLKVFTVCRANAKTTNRKYRCHSNSDSSNQ